MTNLIFFVAVAFAIFGQFSDAWTTEVAMNHGFIEKNSLTAKMIGKIGISPAYAIKCGALPTVAGLTAGLGHESLGAAFAAGIGAVGLVFGVKNYLKLKKAGVKSSEIF